jgi:type IV secretory pathway component VirB8
MQYNLYNLIIIFEAVLLLSIRAVIALLKIQKTTIYQIEVYELTGLYINLYIIKCAF